MNTFKTVEGEIRKKFSDLADFNKVFDISINSIMTASPEIVSETVSHSVVFDPMQPRGAVVCQFLCPWNSP